MQIRTRGIVLSQIKYGEQSLIIKVFTETEGICSYMLKGLLAKRKTGLKPALFFPLSQLSLVAVHRPNKGLHTISEAHIDYPYQRLHTDVYLNALVIFLSEVLGMAIKEEERNEALYSFISQRLIALDQGASMGVFHIHFLLELTRFLGFYPDKTFGASRYFDLLEGAFVADPTAHTYTGAAVDALNELLGTEFDDFGKIKLTKTTKKQVLELLMAYYKMHIPEFRAPKSLPVLYELFA
jgi:DNA repair protein RecO (recombination protein O)